MGTFQLVINYSQAFGCFGIQGTPPQIRRKNPKNHSFKTIKKIPTWLKLILIEIIFLGLCYIEMHFHCYNLKVPNLPMKLGKI